MAMSNKPVVWLPFAAGGMLTALVLPGVMLLVLLVSLGVLPAESLGYERVRAFAANPLGGLAIFFLVVLAVWHAAHRLRMTLQDLGVRGRGARRVVAWLCYGLAGLGTIVLVVALLSV